MAKLLARPSKDKFARRVLTLQEYNVWITLSSRRSLEYISGRFAAKEAIVKALGCGIGTKVGFMDIEVLPNEQGKPMCTLSTDSIHRLGWEDSSFQLHIAITHERSLAAATAIIEK